MAISGCAVAQQHPLHLERLPVELLSLLELVQFAEHPPQVVQGIRELGMRPVVQLALHRDGLAHELDGLLVPALVEQVEGHALDALRDFRTLLAGQLAPQRQRLAEERIGSGIVAHPAQQLCELVHAAGRVDVLVRRATCAGAPTPGGTSAAPGRTRP